MRLLTEVLEQSKRAARADKHAAFAAEALGPAASAATVAAAARRLSAQLLPALSRLRWENAAKEMFWLLALDGVHVGTRAAHQPLPCVLCGGAALADRAHLFWECPPALAVRGALQQELARRGCAVVLERRHVWLMECPNRALHADLWRVACLAAVRAMNGARTRVYTLRDKLPAGPLSTVGCMVAQGALQASWWPTPRR